MTTTLIGKKMYYKNRKDLEPELSISYLIDADDFDYPLTKEEEELMFNGHLKVKAIKVDVNSVEYKIAENNSKVRRLGIPQEFTEHLIQQFKDSLK